MLTHLVAHLSAKTVLRDNQIAARIRTQLRAVSPLPVAIIVGAISESSATSPQRVADVVQGLVASGELCAPSCTRCTNSVEINSRWAPPADCARKDSDDLLLRLGRLYYSALAAQGAWISPREHNFVSPE